MKKIIILHCTLLFLLLSSNTTFAQERDGLNNKLQVEIKTMDSLLFDVAFNQCDSTLFKRIMSPDIEFYDDRSGLNTSLEKEIASFKDKCAKPIAITRQLVNSSTHVLGDYGAVQTGVHEFYVDGKKVEQGKFITVWERTDTSWIVKRAISYDHEAVGN